MPILLILAKDREMIHELFTGNLRHRGRDFCA
jgi:hypothetical protein